MTTALNYLTDFCTRPGYVAAAQQLHGPLRFTFRPALTSERSRLAEVAGEMQPEAFDAHAATFLAGKLVRWDLQGDQGQPIAVSDEALLRLQPELFVKLYSVVLGASASDIDPDWHDDEREEHHAEVQRAEQTGRSIGEVREEGDEKN
jgi:hypothetical protein